MAAKRKQQRDGRELREAPESAHPYLNAFHRQHSERLLEQLSKQPKASLEDAMQQYDRIKQGSVRA
jgi:hypothetical protein